MFLRLLNMVKVVKGINLISNNNWSEIYKEEKDRKKGQKKLEKN